MAQEFHPGQIVPESGICRITHIPQHADGPHEVTVIKGRRFPTCRHCKGISFELVHAAKHVGEVEHLSEHDSSALVTPNMSRHAIALVLAVGVSAALPIFASAQDPACLAFRKDDDGEWIAKQDTPVPGRARPVKAGQAVSDDMQDEPDARCVLSRR